MANYVDYVKPENRLKIVASGLSYYAADLHASALFLRAFVTTVDGAQVDSGSLQIPLPDILAECPVLAEHAADIVAELTAVAVKQGLCPMVDPAITEAFQKAQAEAHAAAVAAAEAAAVAASAAASQKV